MSTQIENREGDRLPKIVCAFAAFFAIAVPAFAICVGRGTHNTWTALAAGMEARGGANPFAVALLNHHEFLLWALFGLSVILAASLLSLMRKNSVAGSLNGAGRIVVALGISAMASTFYLAVLVVAAAFLINPILAQ